ncbi:MAG: divalent-cation tolerance protein CutA [Verrucomicrobiota bacterium]|jgi:periplasmic divalent cation tolerance protein|nr:divalent-cation tolerance protein CutA [Verrucomicrobiota bacterium]
MSVPEDFAVVLVTAPDMDLARHLAKGALEAKLAACANIVPVVESHYWWKGKLESSDEVLLIFKTRQQLLPKLERAVREIHPYDTPEFVALPLTTGSRKYLAWLANNTVKE